MNKIQALYNFWSGFDIPAYDESTVPDTAALPYITFEVATDDFGHEMPVTASLWYRSTKWDAITAKEEQIASAIGRGGIMLPYDGGVIWLKKSTPWAQRMADNDDMIRRIVLQLNIEFLD